MNTHHETILDVPGMSCQSCVRHIREALGQLDGVTEVEVRLRDGKVLVHHDPNEATVHRLIAALREAGYESSLAAAA
ncbi:heavy-metal-associated domain-containing protein [Nannocystis punicea]|uniref:Heavy metal-associated domain-containing protein n=1 Tax=Nannocystis punicea TaxID=2995304 RepID=A0ABY7GWU8_9BACT|nr:heavy metal-associated domain-containing protein [Nannocystis poenicansa]WAS91397.1 heavy metal-associated domain-containing protein [Nannocystis poenicansa]